MKTKKCLCGSNDLLVLTFVKCKKCGAKTKNYQLTTGEHQSEQALAVDDWNKRVLLPI